jgi:hypothetical protein
MVVDEVQRPLLDTTENLRADALGFHPLLADFQLSAIASFRSPSQPVGGCIPCVTTRWQRALSTLTPESSRLNPAGVYLPAPHGRPACRVLSLASPSCRVSAEQRNEACSPALQVTTPSSIRRLAAMPAGHSQTDRQRAPRRSLSRAAPSRSNDANACVSLALCQWARREAPNEQASHRDLKSRR